MLRCPSCRNAAFETVSSGEYRCVAEIMVDAVPPGALGNPGLAAIPIYGTCGYRFDEESGRNAAVLVAERQASDERARQEAQAAAEQRAAERKELARRVEAALATLRAAGNPGVRQRLVPDHRSLSFADRFFRQLREDSPADVEPAWLVGVYTWVRPRPRGSDIYNTLSSAPAVVLRQIQGASGERAVGCRNSRRSGAVDPVALASAGIENAAPDSGRMSPVITRPYSGSS